MDAALVKSQTFIFSQVHPPRKIEHIIQALRWLLAKVAFDTVQVFVPEIFGVRY